RRRHTRLVSDWSSDVCSSDLTALIYYTAYTRSDVRDMSQRPVSFLYNGGPGSSSIWLHMSSMGPRRVVTINAGVTPPAPYKLMRSEERRVGKEGGRRGEA